MNKLKVLHITTYQAGGAGAAAMRLHKALRRHGYDSRFMFFDRGKITDTEFLFAKRRHWWIFILRVLKKLGFPFTTEQRNDYAIRKYKYKVELFTFANTAYKKLREHPLVKESDIIHFHWVSDFVDFKSFFANINKPIVWTLHDMNGFIGGFHYEADLKKFGEQMKALNDQQITIKIDALRNVPSDKLSIITPSSWLYHHSKESGILGRFPHYHIPNGLDTTVFTNKNLKQKRDDGRINVLFVAESLHNHRKGFDIALEVLKDKEVMDKCHFITVGQVDRNKRLPDITYYGIINSEERISEIYNEADIFLLPSREDNLPNSMVESFCCGTPVVGFATGGITESVTDGVNGYLSVEMSPAGLKKALLTCIANIHSFDRSAIAEEARTKYSDEVLVKHISHLYKHMLQPAQEEISL